MMRTIRQAGRWAAAVIMLAAGFSIALRGDDKPPTVLPPLAPFTQLPPATMQNTLEGPRDLPQTVTPGTSGLTLPLPRKISGGGRTIAILGDLSPTNAASDKYIKQAVRELNVLSPDAVFTIGNLVQGLQRSGPVYAKQTLATRSTLDSLNVPWYPCVGRHDVISGERDIPPGWVDRRFEELYERYLGPRFYSVQLGDAHIIVLDSEESVGTGSTISDAQLQWLKEDLNRTFDGRAGIRTGYVIVLLHRPLWREKDGNWDRIHAMLLEFNRRPIVTVEGVDGSRIDRQRPRVVSVYAGGTQAYADEGLRDGINYVVQGATAARIKQDASVAVRGFTLLKFDAADAAGRVHPSVVLMGGDGPGGAAAGTIVGADVINKSERTVLEQIAALPNEALGIEGSLDPVEKKDGDLKLLLNNPLDVPLDVELRLASTRNLSTATWRENANPYVESFDASWEIFVPYLARHLEPGNKERYRMFLRRAEGATEIAPPQVEFVVHWTDPRGRVHDVLLKRRVPIVPHVELLQPPVTILPAGQADPGISLDGDHGWTNAPSGGTFAWELRGDEPRKRSPQWEMAADADTLFVRLRVEDAVHTYTQSKKLEPQCGGLGCDAVSISWAANADATPDSVQRLWLLPFSPKGAELFTNRGAGDQQTPLQPIDEKLGIRSHLDAHDDTYTVTLAIPRKLLNPDAATCVMNITVSDNDAALQTFSRSWAKEFRGPAAWARLTFKVPETRPAPAPATRPATTRPENPFKHLFK